MLMLAAAPEDECERDQEQDSGEQTPGQLARRSVTSGFQAADAFFILAILARFVFASYDFGPRRGGVAGSLQVFGDGLVFVEAHAAGVGADEALVENAAGQLVELVLFQRLQHASADLGGDG